MASGCQKSDSCSIAQLKGPSLASISTIAKGLQGILVLVFISFLSGCNNSQPVTSTTDAPAIEPKSAEYQSEEADLLKRNKAFARLPAPYNRIGMLKEQLEKELAPMGAKVTWDDKSNHLCRSYYATVDHGSGWVQTYHVFSLLENGIAVEPLHVSGIKQTYSIPCNEFSDDVRPLMKRMEKIMGIVQPIKKAGYIILSNKSSNPNVMQHFEVKIKDFDGYVGLTYECEHGQVVQSIGY